MNRMLSRQEKFGRRKKYWSKSITELKRGREGGGEENTSKRFKNKERKGIRQKITKHRHERIPIETWDNKWKKKTSEELDINKVSLDVMRRYANLPNKPHPVRNLGYIMDV